jgi:hypothetical protein
VVWLPPGDWFGFFDGAWYEGDAWHAIYGTRAEIPVFARAGAIVPLDAGPTRNGAGNPQSLALHIFPGADGSFTLYEDEGASQAYQDGQAAYTELQLRWQAEAAEFSIDPVSGAAELVPEGRTYAFVFWALSEPDEILAEINGEPYPLSWRYDFTRGRVEIDALPLTPGEALRVTIRAKAGLQGWEARLEARLRNMVAQFRMETEAKREVSLLLPQIAADPSALGRASHALTAAQRRALLEVAAGCGVHVQAHSGETLWVLWNRRDDPRFTYQLAQEEQQSWRAPQRFRGSGGSVPRALVLRPQSDPSDGWWLAADYLNLMHIVHRYPE